MNTAIRHCGSTRRAVHLLEALFAIVHLTACVAAEQEITVSYSVDPFVDEREVVAIDSRVLAGGCQSDDALRENVLTTDADSVTLTLTEGRYGLWGAALGADCRPLATGCVAVDVTAEGKTQVVDVYLTRSEGEPQCQLLACASAGCTGGGPIDDPGATVDAGVAEMGGEDAALPMDDASADERDAGGEVTDAGTEDAQVDAATGTEMLSNGDFSAGMDPYRLYLSGDTAAATAGVVNGALEVDISDGGTEHWHLQIVHESIPLVAGASYRLRFRASASKARPIRVAMEKAVADFDKRGLDTGDIWVPAGMGSFAFSFVASHDDPAARLVFQLGNEGSGRVVLDDLSLTMTALP